MFSPNRPRLPLLAVDGNRDFLMRILLVNRTLHLERKGYKSFNHKGSGKHDSSLMWKVYFLLTSYLQYTDSLALEYV